MHVHSMHETRLVSSRTAIPQTGSDASVTVKSRTDWMVRRETYGDICHRIDMKQWRLAGLSYGRTGAVIITSFM